MNSSTQMQNAAIRTDNSEFTTIKIKRTKKTQKTGKIVETSATSSEKPVITASQSDIMRMIVDEKHTENLKKHIEENSFDMDGAEVLSHLGDFVEEPYSLIESYFSGQYLERLVRHQIESYNNFINFQAARTIQMFNPVTIRSENDFVVENGKYFLEILVSFENFKLYPPQIHENNGATKTMLPHEAKLRNFTYASAMTIDLQIQYIIRNTDKMDAPKIINKTLPKINIGKMPIMLKSSICILTQNRHISNKFTGECPMDCGGYFIIKGSEKTVLGQERAAENRVYCFDGKNTAKWSWFAEIKSVPDFKCISPKQIEMMISSKNTGFGNGMFITVPRIKQPIELFVLFRALGVLSDKAICEYIVLDIEDAKQKDILIFLKASVIDASKHITQEDALKYVTTYVAYTPMNMDKEMGMKKKREFALDVLSNDLFPHCKSLPQKLYLLGYMANKLIQTSLGWKDPDDRDSYLNKRIELTGTLLNNLFRNYFNKLVKEMQKQVVREINNGSWSSSENYANIINMTNIYKIMKSTTIENGINRALSTGDFSIKQANSSKVGVAQVLNRLTYMASMSHLRRINTPLEKSGELIAPRKLHNTTWGFLCLTGDTEVLMADRITMKKMKDMKDGDLVNTVNPETLADEPSEIHSFFKKMPDKLYEITTVSGRKIKATANHPFLININGKPEWRNLEDLRKDDKVIIRHMTKAVCDENNKEVQYKKMLALDYFNMEHSNNTLKIIARLLGMLNTKGQLDEVVDDNNNKCYHAIFYMNEQTDIDQLTLDILNIGFGMEHISTSRKIVDFNNKIVGGNTKHTWEVCVKEGCAQLLFLMGGIVGNKQESALQVPSWLVNAELSIQREFISAFQHDFGIIVLKMHNNYLEYTIKYIEQITTIFTEFGIKSNLKIAGIDTNMSNVCMVFENSSENLVKYADVVNFTYCDENRRTASCTIELVKIKGYTPSFHAESNSKTNTEIYETYLKGNMMSNGCISVPIASICECEPEFVYDFTTHSENHSFVASSFVTHNCPVETPEGASIGIVKNISYMAHITIPTSSASLYEYTYPHILRIEDLTAVELHGKVKVFINGAWIGISNSPMELYQELKDKKYKGIINIYTSIIFDFKNCEIRVCSDGGRLTRPVLRVKNGSAIITKDIISRLSKKELCWNDLLTSCNIPESVIEYIDPEEQNHSMIAMKVKNAYLQNDDMQMKFEYTHCEIHPSTIFGVLASCTPFPEHNQAPRNTYQCLGKDELVWMADGTKKRICDVRIGDKVQSFNPVTLEVSETEVIRQFVRPNEFPVYRIRTTSGRTIVATEDHKFMTNCGWKTVKDMLENKYLKIGIAMENTAFTIATDTETATANSLRDRVSISNPLLDKRTMVIKLENMGISNRIATSYANILTNSGVLPLSYRTDPRLAVIARIAGFVLSGNAIINIRQPNREFAEKNTYCEFEIQKHTDAESLMYDLHILGFNNCEILYGSYRNSTTQQVYNVSYKDNDTLAALMMCLDVSFGHQFQLIDTHLKSIPEWILQV